MKLAVFLAAALSVAAPTSSAAILLAEVTNPVTGPISAADGNYIEPGVSGYFTNSTIFFTINVGFVPGVFRRFDSLQFDYRTTSSTSFDVLMSVMIPGTGRFTTPTSVTTFQEPVATQGFKTAMIDLGGAGFGSSPFGSGEGFRYSFSVVGFPDPNSPSGSTVSFNNILLKTLGSAITPVPEPGSMLSVACLLGAGAFVRRRAMA